MYHLKTFTFNVSCFYRVLWLIYAVVFFMNRLKIHIFLFKIPQNKVMTHLGGFIKRRFLKTGVSRSIVARIANDSRDLEVKIRESWLGNMSDKR